MAPDLAATLIRAYSQPGDLVLDPLAGAGTTLVEALHLGRNALGLTDDPGWTALARANIAHARRQGANGHARVLAGEPTRLPAGIPAELHGQVTLVLTNAPPRRTMSVGIRRHRDRSNTAGDAPYPATRHRIQLFDGLTAVLAGCVPLLTPAGILAVASRPWYRDATLTDPTAQIIHAGHSAGLILVACHRAVHDRIPHRRVAASRDVDVALDGRKHHDATQVLVRHDDIAVFRASPDPARLGSPEPPR
jgi:hypothetical protein